MSIFNIDNHLSFPISRVILLITKLKMLKLTQKIFSKNIGIVGLSNPQTIPFTKNLLARHTDQDINISVYEVGQDNIDSFQKSLPNTSIQSCASPKELLSEKDCSIILTFLSSSNKMKEVYLDEKRGFAAYRSIAKPKKVTFIDGSHVNDSSEVFKKAVKQYFSMNQQFFLNNVSPTKRDADLNANDSSEIFKKLVHQDLRMSQQFFVSILQSEMVDVGELDGSDEKMEEVLRILSEKI